ncbi:MAG: hypothetical protein PHR56_05850 [Dehalococcoidales bacterium]|nr:hypothetical protein [Dehalococcoidales bacterium]
MTISVLERPATSVPPHYIRPEDETELVAFCPGCKTLETLWFSEGRLMTTRRFHEENGQVFHNCGSTKPCRLHRSS